MKKLYILTCLIGLSVFVFGQTYLSEDFSANQMPPSGWSIDGLPAQWSVSGSANAGGIAPEAKFTYVQGNTTTRLITPAIDLTGLTSVSLNFKHMYDWYANPAPKFGVATRSGGGAWTSIWEVLPTGNVGPEEKTFNITNGDVGQPDFQFCFYLTGNMYNIDYWFIDDVWLFLPLQTDAALISVNLPQYVQYGVNLDLTGTVKNLGSDPITSFDVSYTVNGGTPAVYSVTGVTLPFGATYNFTHSTPIYLPEAGTYEIVTTIENVNGGDDQYPENNTLTKYVGAVPFVPAKKVFAEEATGTWCGWCVRGICFMDYMAETYPDTWIGVAVHNGDPMVVAAYDNAIPNIIPNFPGYPSGTIDRAGSDYWDPSDFETGYLQRMQAISPATVEIANFTWDPATRVVSFDVQSEFVVDLNQEFRFCAVLAEDSVWGTATGYNQANYYSGGGQGPMCGFESLPGTIPAADMHYDHVARAILDTPYGTVGSLPSPVTTGMVYSHTYTYTLPDTWVFEKMHFIGLLIDMATGEVLNSNNVVSTQVGINEVAAGQQVVVYPNPTTGNVIINGADNASIAVYDTKGMLIRKVTNFNGTILGLSDLPEGIYILTITTENNTIINRKISILK